MLTPGVADDLLLMKRRQTDNTARHHRLVTGGIFACYRDVTVWGLRGTNKINVSSNSCDLRWPAGAVLELKCIGVR